MKKTAEPIERYAKILANDWTISTKTLYAWIEVDGQRLGAAAALYLSQIHFWRGVYGRPFHKTWYELQLETGLNREEQKTARRKCGALIQTYRRKPMGQDGKLKNAPVSHYDVDHLMLARMISDASERVSAFILANVPKVGMGEDTHTEWVKGPIQNGAVAPRSKTESTTDPTSDLTFAGKPAPSSEGSLSDVSTRHNPEPPEEKKVQGGRVKPANPSGSREFAQAMDAAAQAMGRPPLPQKQWGREVDAAGEILRQYGSEQAVVLRERFLSAVRAGKFPFSGIACTCAAMLSKIPQLPVGVKLVASSAEAYPDRGLSASDQAHVDRVKRQRAEAAMRRAQ